MKLPKDYKDYLLQHWNVEDVEILVQGLEAEPSVSIRLNPSRLPADALPLGADGRVPWCQEGVYLRERPQFTADPLLHSGAYYVQEASSMFLAHVVRWLLKHFPAPAVALDLCAAPGGKSTLLRSFLPDDCWLMSNEPLRSRAQVLAENMAKWGHPRVMVTQAYAAEIAHFIGEQLDFILADVPCSGEGMFRKEEEALRQWSPAFVNDCAALQRSIVQDIWPALRPGGILVYSTCTFNPEEDELNVEWIARELGAEVLRIPLDDAWGIRGDLRKASAAVAGSHLPLPCYHFLPGAVRGEGFFLAVLQKCGEEKIHQKHTKSTGMPDSIDSMLKAVHSPQQYEKFSERVTKKNRFIDGKRTNQTRKNPSQPPKRDKAQQNISTITFLPIDQLDDAAAPRVELSLVDAVRYLQRESLVLPSSAPLGRVQVCFQGQRLGFMNNLGSRANNLYPKEWRIRSSYVEAATLFPDS